ncbi:hypothetical protein Hanom_Chr02g00158891 [Helianthus anomalus]
MATVVVYLARSLVTDISNGGGVFLLSSLASTLMLWCVTIFMTGEEGDVVTSL